MTLHTVGPSTATEDEHKIGSGYQTWLAPIYVAAPLAGVQYLDMKWVIGMAIGAALLNLHEIGGRLHDLCIRLRRTNILLGGQNRS
jgi:hypothetical protein